MREVLQEWLHPEHDVFRETNPNTALRRGEALHALFDAVVGMS